MPFFGNPLICRLSKMPQRKTRKGVELPAKKATVCFVGSCQDFDLSTFHQFFTPMKDSTPLFSGAYPLSFNLSRFCKYSLFSLQKDQPPSRQERQGERSLAAGAGIAKTHALIRQRRKPHPLGVLGGLAVKPLVISSMGLAIAMSKFKMLSHFPLI